VVVVQETVEEEEVELAAVGAVEDAVGVVVEEGDAEVLN
jgi:hypothetical protein